MSEIIYSFDTTQWEALKLKLKQELSSTPVNFCTDYSFCKNYTTINKIWTHTNLGVTSQQIPTSGNVEFEDLEGPISLSAIPIIIDGDDLDFLIDDDEMDDNDLSLLAGKTYSRGNYYKCFQYFKYGQYGQYSRYYRTYSQYYRTYSQYSKYTRYTRTYSKYYKYTQYTSQAYVPPTYDRIPTPSYVQYYRYYVCGNCSNYSQDTYSKYAVTETPTYTQINEYAKSLSFSTNLPSAPVFYGLDNVVKVPLVRGSIKLAMFAYDTDAASDTSNGTVYYDLYIQQIKDKNGITVKNGALIKVLSNQAEDSLGAGLTYDFNSELYDDGYYRLIAVSRNAPVSKSYNNDQLNQTYENGTVVASTVTPQNTDKTYYQQDIPTDSITATAEGWDGINLSSGLNFNAGESSSSVSLNNDETGVAIPNKDMFTVKEICIKHNTPSFFEVSNIDSSAVNILNFIFSVKKDTAQEATTGAYNTITDTKLMYGTEAIAQGDIVVKDNNMVNGFVAKIDLTEPDVSNWVEATALLYNLTTGETIENSTTLAKFVSGDISSTYSLVSLIKGAGTEKLNGYFYWDIDTLDISTLTNGLEDVGVKVTVNEYTDSTKATLLLSRTSTTTKLNSETDDVTGSAFNLKLDAYAPNISYENLNSTDWVTSARYRITVDDRFKNGSADVSGTGSPLEKSIITAYAGDGSVLDTVNLTGDKIATSQQQDVEFTIPDGTSDSNVSIKIESWDVAGNYSTKTISNIKIDNCLTPTITYDDTVLDKWHKEAINPTITASKNSGATIKTIKIAETLNPEAPAIDSADWETINVSSLTYDYITQKAGVITGTYYVHVIVDDGLHPAFSQTIGPYKLNTVKPEITGYTCSALADWQTSTEFLLSAKSNADGPGLESIVLEWFDKDGISQGRVENTDCKNKYTADTSIPINIDDKTFDGNISVKATLTDAAGNVTEKTYNQIKLDRTETSVSVDNEPADKWVNTEVIPSISIEKAGGKNLTSVWVAETTSPDMPADDSAEWQKDVVNETSYGYVTKEIGRSSNEHYLFVKVNDGLHTPITKTYGPYKVDLDLPVIDAYSCDAINTWKISTDFNLSVRDNEEGSPLKSAKLEWFYPDGTSGGVISKDYTSTPSFDEDLSINIAIPEGEFYPDLKVVATIEDISGNVLQKNYSNIMLDNTETVISASKPGSSDWVIKVANPIYSFNKAGGVGLGTIKFAETKSPTAPDLDSSEWETIDTSDLTLDYVPLKAGKITGEYYMHIYTKDALHPAQSKTYGPYRTDLAIPYVTDYQCDAINAWKKNTNFSISIEDNIEGAPLKDLKLSWYYSNGTLGGTKTVDLTEAGNKFTGESDIDISIPDNTSDSNIKVIAEASDMAGNKFSKTYPNIKIDTTHIDILSDVDVNPNWIDHTVEPIITVAKSGGIDLNEVWIAETNSPIMPSDDSEEWNKGDISDIQYVYSTAETGRTSNSHYVHVKVNDGLHDMQSKTIGPYKVDLESPTIDSVTCDAFNTWKINTTFETSISDNVNGAPIKLIELNWYYSDGTLGGTVIKDYTAQNVSGIQTHDATVSIPIEVDEGIFDENIKVKVKATDDAGNSIENVYQNIKIDNTTASVNISPDIPSNWINYTVNPVVTIEKPNGQELKSVKVAFIKIDDDSDLSLDVDNESFVEIPITSPTLTSHQMNISESGKYYIGVIVNDELHEDIFQAYEPYKIDINFPHLDKYDVDNDIEDSDRWQSQYNINGFFWEPIEIKTETHDDGGSHIDTRKYLVDNTPQIPDLELEGWIDVPWSQVSDNIFNVPITEEGDNYIHTYIEDGAGNKIEDNEITSLKYRLDLNNPTINVNTKINSSTGVPVAGKVVGYITHTIKVTDPGTAPSGVAVVKYAITGDATPPAQSKDGSTKDSLLGRTDGWVDITEDATSGNGYKTNLKHAGKSFLHIYVEDNAGRKYNSTVNTADATFAQSVKTIPMAYEIVPTYFSGIRIVDPDNTLIAASDSKQSSSGDSFIYALNNKTNQAPITIDYVNYVDETKKIRIDIKDKNDKIVRTVKDSVNLDIGETADGSASSYNMNCWWINNQGNLLPSGIYKIQATLYTEEEGDINTMTSYIILNKGNTLVQPVINTYNSGESVKFDVSFEKDTFLEDLQDEYASGNSLISDFLDKLNSDSRYQTKYNVKTMDESGEVQKSLTRKTSDLSSKTFKIPNATEDPIEVLTYTSILASVKDTFGNESKVAKSINFSSSISGNISNMTPEQIAEVKQDAVTKAEDLNKSKLNVKVIETPKADNYFINTNKIENAKFTSNPFSFIETEDDTPDGE